MTQTLRIITGATAVGKTEYALSYAEKHNAEIVSCDASLVYRGMDIGTAKPTSEELARVLANRQQRVRGTPTHITCGGSP